MELNQLRYFKAVVQTESITKAAEQLYITQPALSRVILRLEAELNTKLFDRSSSKITLNDNGRVFYMFVSKALENIDNAVKAVSNSKSDTTIVRAKSHLLTDALMSSYDLCQAAYPSITFEFSDLYDEGAAPEGGFDIVLSAAEAIDGMVKQAAFEEKWCVIVSKSYFPAQKTTISLAELADEPIVFFGTEEDKRFVFRMFDDVGEKPNLIIVNNIKNTSSMINKRLAIGCVPFSIYYQYFVRQPGGIPFDFLLLDNQKFERQVYLHRRKDFPKSDIGADALRCIEENIADFMRGVSEYYEDVLQSIGK